MDFMNRGFRPAQTGESGAPASAPQHTKSSNNRSGGGIRSLRIASVVLLFSVAVLLIALAVSFFFGPAGGEARLVNKDRYQAVFLNGGQVYFGRITDLNDRYIQLEEIFYLRVTQQVQPPENNTQQGGDLTLVPLGCELHRPTSVMVINREQVIFWENLKDESGENTVPGAVKKFKAANPQGQQCAQPAQNTNTNTNTNNSNQNNEEDE